MKKYIKSKSSSTKPNASGPKYRTPDHFKGSLFGSNKKNLKKTHSTNAHFNPAQFKTQHKG